MLLFTGSDVIDHLFIMLVLMLLNQLVAEYVTDLIVTWSDVIDQFNVCWWPDVKPIHSGLDVIDHFVETGWVTMQMLRLCLMVRHRAKTVCSNHYLLEEEEEHLNKALSKCRYPAWALNRARINIKKKKKNIRMNTNTDSKKPYIVVPYMKGLSETCKNICRRHGHRHAL